MYIYIANILQNNKNLYLYQFETTSYQIERKKNQTYNPHYYYYNLNMKQALNFYYITSI